MNEQSSLCVLFLCDYSPAYGGNFVPSLLALEKAVTAQNGRCVFAFPQAAAAHRWFKQLQEKGKTVVAVNVHQGRLALARTVAALVKEHHVTLIHSHFFPMLPLEIFSWFHPNTRVLIHLHSDWSLGKTSWKQKLKFFLLCKLFAVWVRFLSVSPALVAYNPSKITYVPNALATDRLPHTPVDLAALREKLGVQAGETLCEIFAWSPEAKGLDIAVKAVKQAREKGARVKLAVVHGDALPPEKLRAWVAARPGCGGADDFVYYLPPTEDVFGYHQAADILISASRSEGFSYSILEMLSLGKRAVVSDIPGVAWSKAFAGVFPFPSENVPAAAEALQKALAAPARNATAAQQIEKQYNIANWTAAVTAQYNNF